jgi:hypothetical protein
MSFMQSVHAVALAAALNLPAAHDTHVDEPVDAPNEPAAHACGTDEPARHAKPGWQTIGADMPVDGQWLPDKQTVQTVACASEAKTPGAHGTRAAARETLVK